MPKMKVNPYELTAFILYFLILLGIGAYFFLKSRNEGEADYFLGGRKMGPWVTGLSAQASDMSGWLLMGFPGSILLAGLGEVWIAIGLALGSYLTWLLVAGRLRTFSKTAGDAITIPQYLNNRFRSRNKLLQVISAVIFFVFFALYVASGFKAGATLFNTVLGIDTTPAMVIFGVIIILYTFTGGFKAVCWTDFFQAILMLFAIVLVPLVIYFTNDISVAELTAQNPQYFSLFPTGSSWQSVVSGLAWGLGYCGMPHIIIRYMAIKDRKDVKRSRAIATSWVVITLAAAVVIGILGRLVLPELATAADSPTVFIRLVRMAFPAFLSGVLLSAILAASMSTADSQLLVASSAFTSDIYKPFFRKNAGNKELLWVGRSVVALISVAAFVIASLPGTGGIMSLVSNAWAGFGAAFGPVILLSLYWKRFTYWGALSGIVGGAATVVVWILFFTKPTGIYELFPGFAMGLLCCIVGSLLDKKPSAEVEELFDSAVATDKAEAK